MRTKFIYIDIEYIAFAMYIMDSSAQGEPWEKREQERNEIWYESWGQSLINLKTSEPIKTLCFQNI